MYAQSCLTPWTVAPQALLSMGLSRQEYWRGLPFPSPGGLPNPGIEPLSPGFPTLTGGFFTTESPGKPQINLFNIMYLSLFLCLRVQKHANRHLNWRESQMTAFYIFQSQWKLNLKIHSLLCCLKNIFIKFICLVALGLSCNTKDFAIFVEACRSFSYGMRTLTFHTWDLVPWPGSEP